MYLKKGECVEGETEGRRDHVLYYRIGQVRYIWGEQSVSSLEQDLTTSPLEPGTTKKLGMANSMLAQTLLFIDFYSILGHQATTHNSLRTGHVSLLSPRWAWMGISHLKR